jgi:hypothetical protein
MQNYVSVGDTDGTVSIMQMNRALYDPTLQPKEKEQMATIFEREFRREKNLEVAKNLAKKAPPPKKEDPQKEEKK